MTENQSTFSGRKIRIEGQDELKIPHSEPNEKAELGYITFGEAESKGILKPGMAVVFENCIFDPIDLDEEMTGEKQRIESKFARGVIVKKNDGKYAIFSILQLTSENGLILNGRYGRANGFQAVCHIVKNVSKKIKNCSTHFFAMKDFLDFCGDNYLAIDYFVNAFSNRKAVTFANKEEFIQYYSNEVDRWYYISIPPGSLRRHFNYIAILIEGDNISCSIKKGTAKTITSLNTYFQNPYDRYVEIRGG